MDFLGRGLHQQADFPVASVVAQCDRPAIRGADAALCADDEELSPAQLVGVPAHPRVLAVAKDVAARRFDDLLYGQRQLAAGTGSAGADLVDRIIGLADDFCKGISTHATSLFFSSVLPALFADLDLL